MSSYSGKLNIIKNTPYPDGLYSSADNEQGNIPPFETFFWVDNLGDFMVTNTGDNLIFNPGS